MNIILRQLQELGEFARIHSDKEFLCCITGGGYNGYTVEEIQEVYRQWIKESCPPSNILIQKAYDFRSGKQPSCNSGISTYAGIGSRKTPRKVLEEMSDIARRLERKGYTLRSGGAKGADSAFEQGVSSTKMMEVYRPEDCEAWCLSRVANYVPADRPPLEKMSRYVQQLLGRNMKQIFGPRGNEPVEFVICWTPLGKDDGGTGYAIRAARDNGIPVYNLKNQNDREEFYSTYLK